MERVEFSSGMVISFRGRERWLKGVFMAFTHLGYFLIRNCFWEDWSVIVARATIFWFCFRM